MKKIAALFIVVLFTITAIAQTEVPLTRQEKKAMRVEQKQQAEVILTSNTAQALRSGRFVLKADQLRAGGGYLVMVNPNVNFVAVEGEDAYVQVVSPVGTGFYGTGITTIRGKITSFDLQQGKKQDVYRIMMNTIGPGSQLNIIMSVNKTGEMASATVRTNWGRSIDMSGVLVPWTGK